MKLSDERVVRVDLSKISVKEYEGLKNPAFQDDDSYTVIEKCTGISKKEISDMPMNDLRVIIGAIMKHASRPIFDTGDFDNPS